MQALPWKMKASRCLLIRPVLSLCPRAPKRITHELLDQTITAAFRKQHDNMKRQPCFISLWSSWWKVSWSGRDLRGGLLSGKCRRYSVRNRVGRGDMNHSVSYVILWYLCSLISREWSYISYSIWFLVEYRQVPNQKHLKHEEQQYIAGEEKCLKWFNVTDLKQQYVTFWATRTNAHRNVSYRSVILIESKYKKR